MIDYLITYFIIGTVLNIIIIPLIIMWKEWLIEKCNIKSNMYYSIIFMGILIFIFWAPIIMTMYVKLFKKLYL